MISSNLLFRLAKCRVVSVILVRLRVCYKERRSNVVRDSVRTSREFEIIRLVFAVRRCSRGYDLEAETTSRPSCLLRLQRYVNGRQWLFDDETRSET